MILSHVEKKLPKKLGREHYSVYRAILTAHGGEDRVFIFFIFCHFFSTCEKITQFLEFFKDQGGKI